MPGHRYFSSARQRLVREAEIALGDREEMLHQRLHVLGPLPERRHVEVDDAQPVQQVLAELAGGDELVQVAIGGGDHAHVDPRLRVVGADRLDLAVLEKPQQQRLHAQAHLADFVEKQRAAMRELELAALVAVGAGEAALDVAEELRLEERFGDAGAVHRHERRQPAAGVAMDVARDHVLAHAALAGDQDLGRALRRPRGHGEQFRHGRAGDDEAWLLQRSTGTRRGTLTRWLTWFAFCLREPGTRNTRRLGSRCLITQIGYRRLAAVSDWEIRGRPTRATWQVTNCRQVTSQ